MGTAPLPISVRIAAIEESIPIPISIDVLMTLAIILAGVAIPGDRRGGPNADAVGQEEQQKGEAKAVAPTQQHCGRWVVQWDESSPVPSNNP